MGTKYLIDSNAIIDYLAGHFPKLGMKKMNEIVDDGAMVSVISKIEVLGFNAPESSYKVLLDFSNNTILLGLSDDIVDQTIQLCKKHKIKLPDAIIAATALSYDLILMTRNLKDFQRIKGLTLINFHKD